MTYAIIDLGGAQHRVAPGETIRVNRLAAAGAEKGKDGRKIDIERILLVNVDGACKVGSPLVEGATVKATVLGEEQGKKVLVFKKKRRKQYRRLRGHRQRYTSLRIDEIQAGK